MKRLTVSSVLSALAIGALSGCSSTGVVEEPPTSSEAQPLAKVQVSGNTVRAKLPVKAHLRLDAQVDGCTNHPGPTITLSGNLFEEGIGARVVGKNNRKGTHVTDPPADVAVNVELTPSGDIEVPKQPSQGGAGGNPWIYVQVYDASWRSLSRKILLGRCVQGLTSAAIPLLLQADASLTVDTDFCTNSPGPTITLSGEATIGAINARVFFQNNLQGTHQTDPEDLVLELTLVRETPFRWHKAPPFGGAGGNPLIYATFTDPQFSPISNEALLGRCNKL